MIAVQGMTTSRVPVLNLFELYPSHPSAPGKSAIADGNSPLERPRALSVTTCLRKCGANSGANSALRAERTEKREDATDEGMRLARVNWRGSIRS